MSGIDQRKEYTEQRSTKFVAHLTSADNIVADHTSVIATGSYGRLEASEHSDLDLVIVSKQKIDTLLSKQDDYPPKSSLSGIDEICLKADLIAAARAIGITKFDADGKFLSHYPIFALTGNIGTSDDDNSNTFTSRLLVLLEGRPLLGAKVYSDSVDSIITSYWRDYQDHRDDFAPAYLLNDILRLWRTFCVNYEARTESVPLDKKLERRLKNYKLKFSRLLTCYSALIQMLDIYGKQGTVSPSAMKDISIRTPIDRINQIASDHSRSSAHVHINSVLKEYEYFLKTTDRPKQELLESFANSDERAQMLNHSYNFADSLFKAIGEIGGGTKLHRMLVV